jgi:uncharacterized integral membrane protein (TIGR00698 family)
MYGHFSEGAAMTRIATWAEPARADEATDEGAGEVPDVVHGRVHSRGRARLRELGPGLAAALAIAAVATGLGRLVPVIGGPVIAVVLGTVLATALPRMRDERLKPGIAVAGKGVLQASIVVLGTGLSLQEVARVGVRSLPVMLGTLTVALGGAWLFGRLLRVRGDVRTLIGIGTGICGASAIAAATAVIDAAEADVAYALGTIFAFNVVAVLAFPPLGHLLGMSSQAFGLWSGTAVNDTSSVAAAAYAYSPAAGAYAIIVKLTRSLMLIPIVTTLAVVTSRRKPGASAAVARLPWHKIVPPFLLGFVVAAAADSLGLIPAGWHGGLQNLGTFLIAAALAAIGLSLRLAELRRAGPRPLLLGAALWICVVLASLGLQALTGTG